MSTFAPSDKSIGEAIELLNMVERPDLALRLNNAWINGDAGKMMEVCFEAKDVLFDIARQAAKEAGCEEFLEQELKKLEEEIPLLRLSSSRPAPERVSSFNRRFTAV